MKRLLPLFLCLVMGVSAFAENKGYLREVKGKVEIKPFGKSWITAKEGMAVDILTTISTGFDSSAVLTIQDNRISVAPLTRLTVDKIVEQAGTLGTSLHLRVGKVSAEVKSSKGLAQSFKVTSPYSTASVRGTKFSYDGLSLNVKEGRVAFIPGKPKREIVVPKSVGQRKELPPAAGAAPAATDGSGTGTAVAGSTASTEGGIANAAADGSSAENSGTEAADAEATGGAEATVSDDSVLSDSSMADAGVEGTAAEGGDAMVSTSDDFGLAAGDVGGASEGSESAFGYDDFMTALAEEFPDDSFNLLDESGNTYVVPDEQASSQDTGSSTTGSGSSRTGASQSSSTSQSGTASSTAASTEAATSAEGESPTGGDAEATSDEGSVDETATEDASDATSADAGSDDGDSGAIEVSAGEAIVIDVDYSAPATGSSGAASATTPTVTPATETTDSAGTTDTDGGDEDSSGASSGTSGSTGGTTPTTGSVQIILEY